MNNDQAYAEGLLYRALDPAFQPPTIQEFLRTEEELVRKLVPRGARVVDFGCGTGRHLIGLHDHVSFGVGIDYEVPHIEEAHRLSAPYPLHFVVSDAARVPVEGSFDRALCLTNTLGTMSDKAGVLREMHRLSPAPGSRLVTLYAETSVDARSEWYSGIGYDIVEVTDEHIATTGFESEHFSEARVRDLVGDCRLHPLGEIGWVVQT